MAGHKHALTLRLKAELLHCKKKMAWTWIRIDALHVDIIACLLVVLESSTCWHKRPGIYHRVSCLSIFLLSRLA